jgi:prevent-host-death family protein
MIVQTIPICRLKRELNRVLRTLARNSVDAYIVTRKGLPAAYLLSVSHFESLLAQVAVLGDQLERVNIDRST